MNVLCGLCECQFVDYLILDEVISVVATVYWDELGRLAFDEQLATLIGSYSVNLYLK